MTFLPTFALILALADAATPAAAVPATVAKAPKATRPASLEPSVAVQILRVRGVDVVDGHGHAVMLRGVAFGNQVWTNVRLPRQDHAEVD